MIHSRPRGAALRDRIRPHSWACPVFLVNPSSATRGRCRAKRGRVGVSAASTRPHHGSLREPTLPFRGGLPHHETAGDGVRHRVLSNTCLARVAGHREGTWLAGLALNYSGGRAWWHLGAGAGSPTTCAHHLPVRAGRFRDALARLIAGSKLRTGSQKPGDRGETAQVAAGRLGVRREGGGGGRGWATLLLTPIAPMSVTSMAMRRSDMKPIKDFRARSRACDVEMGARVGGHVPA